MTAALAVPATLLVGEQLTIAATGFADTTAMTCFVSFPEETMSIELKGTSSGGGALTFSTNAVLAPQVPGIVTVTASDGTHTVVETCEVFQN